MAKKNPPARWANRLPKLTNMEWKRLLKSTFIITKWNRKTSSIFGDGSYKLYRLNFIQLVISVLWLNFVQRWIGWTVGRKFWHIATMVKFCTMYKLSTPIKIYTTVKRFGGGAGILANVVCISMGYPMIVEGVCEFYVFPYGGGGRKTAPPFHHKII